MIILKCLLCDGELDIVGNIFGIDKKVKCRKCTFTNTNEAATFSTEVLVIRKKNIIRE